MYATTSTNGQVAIDVFVFCCCCCFLFVYRKRGFHAHFKKIGLYLELEAVKSCESRAMMCENVNNACKKGAVM